VADEYFIDENIKSPVEKGDPERRAEVHTRYEQILLAEVGVKADWELLAGIMKRIAELFRRIDWVLYDDVLPIFKTLKHQALILGLLTNMAKDMAPVCQKLGLESYLDFVVTSEEAGVDKPHPLIFETALQRAGVEAVEAVHVGDQYRIDVIGAIEVGIRPVLLDRYNHYSDITDFPRIHSLTELADYI
jgi:putative hydrolase of the HAD superfamily